MMEVKVVNIFRVLLLTVFPILLVYVWYRSSDYNIRYNVVSLKEYYHRKIDIMEHRLIALHSGCKNQLRNNYVFNFSQNREMFYVDKKANLSYCKVPKAGSSFWTKIFLMLEGNDVKHKKTHPKGDLSLHSVFGTNRDQLHAIGRAFRSRRPLNERNIGTLNVLVSRDPYSRLFSAYVDKYFLLGHSIKARAIAMENHKGIGRSDRCGYDVSFQDFLDRVLKDAFTGKSINQHWSPVYLLCHPCNVRYDIVSKVETLTHDVEYIINISNVRQETKTSLRQVFEGKCLNDTITSVIRALYTQWQSNKNICPIKVNFFSKVLLAFKIQGILGNNHVIPKKDIISITVEQFIEIVLHNVAVHPLTNEEKRIQRRAALVQAWKSVDRNTIIKIQKLYSLDFMLFEYDVNPPT